MPKRMLLAFSVLILNSAQLVAQEDPRPVDQGSVEQVSQSPEGDYARREQDAGHLDAFRGGASGAGGVELLLVPFLIFLPIVKLVALFFERP